MPPRGEHAVGAGPRPIAAAGPVDQPALDEACRPRDWSQVSRRGVDRAIGPPRASTAGMTTGQLRWAR